MSYQQRCQSNVVRWHLIPRPTSAAQWSGEWQKSGKMPSLFLLMLQKSGEHQLIWRNSFRFRRRVSSTLVETDSKFAPENGGSWKTFSFPFGIRPIFSGISTVSPCCWRSQSSWRPATLTGSCLSRHPEPRSVLKTKNPWCWTTKPRNRRFKCIYIYIKIDDLT